MKKILLLLMVALPLPFLVACPGKGGNNSQPVVGIAGGMVTTPPGSYVMAGMLTNINPSCGSVGAATITVSQSNGGYNSYGGPAICTASVGIGGAFNCPVPAPGVYSLRAQAGNCVVQGNMQALTNGMQALQVCLGAGCSCYSSQNCVVNKADSNSSITASFSGSGDLKINSSAIYLSSSNPTSFEVSVEASNGNELLNTSGTWKGSLAADGSLSLDSEKIDSLSYSAQVDAKLLQYEQGFCDTAASAATKSANYTRQLGMSDKAAQAVQDGFSTLNERVCVYPQGETEISRVVTLKSPAKLNTNRVWFIVVEESQLSAGIKSISRPKAEAIAATKKAITGRKIASDNGLLAEEVALGFVIKK